jgi:hypothetical protein
VRPEEPNAFVDFFDPEPLAGEHGGEPQLGLSCLTATIIRRSAWATGWHGVPAAWSGRSAPPAHAADSENVAPVLREISNSRHRRHLLAVEQAGHETKMFVHPGTLLPRHFALLQRPGALPMSPVSSVTLLSGRAQKTGRGRPVHSPGPSSPSVALPRRSAPRRKACRSRSAPRRGRGRRGCGAALPARTRRPRRPSRW